MKVVIEAEIVREQDKVLTVKLLNGFAEPEVQVHRDNVFQVLEPRMPA